MTKFCGKIGFAVQEEKAPGYWEPSITEQLYKGDLIRNRKRLQTTNQLNDNISISNEISILADPYAQYNFHSIVYVEFMGVKWKVTSVDVQYPRLVLELGGIYNE